MFDQGAEEKAKMTSAALLPRIETAHLPATLRPANDLAEKTHKELGYGPLWRDRTKYCDEIALLEACAAVGIRPFQTQAVKEYMTKQKRQHSAKHIAGWLFVAMVASAVVGAAGGLATGNHGWAVVMGASIAFLIAGGIRAMYEEERQWYWNDTSLASYDRQVPEGILNMALLFKERLPQSKFMVHELTQDRRLSDPFLSVHLGDAMFYIAQWDEPKFEAEYV